MSEYRRWRAAGGTYFFTLVTFRRRPILAEPSAIAILGRALREERKRRPFRTDAIVVLPDHVHLIMTLPDGDDDFSTRLNQVKGRFTTDFDGRPSANPRRRRRRMHDVWQPRFWEHLTRDDEEREALSNYVHYNPVKHGYVRCPHDWRWSSFHHWAKRGWLEPAWSCSCRAPAIVPYPASLEELCGEPE